MFVRRVVSSANGRRAISSGSSASSRSSWSSSIGRFAAATLLVATGGSAAVAMATRPDEEPPSWFTLLSPLLRTMFDAETAHTLAVKLLRQSKAVRKAALCVDTDDDDEVLATEVWGLRFGNPLGMAAGFDKNAEAVQGVLELGFGFVEVGSVTPNPQPGNAKPRVFRLVEDQAVINRYGFNSDGHAAVRRRLKQLPPLQGVIGVNLGKNRTSEKPEFDYVKGVRMLGKFGDYIVVNVSSPNTPGLRALQGRDALQSLLTRVKQERDKLPRSIHTTRRPPLLVKIAPDLTDQDKADIAHVAAAVGVDGIIVSNTTLSRPDWLQSDRRDEPGGLSGRPLMEESTRCLRDMYRLTQGRIPLVGVGGVCSGADAYRKIRAGASLVQLYSSLVYGGPPLVRKVKQDLAECLRRDGFTSVGEAVGADA